MIDQWTLKNFKSIRDETNIQLFPLTIIAGTNSSGKSTILQSILLITQTLQSRFKKQQLILNGELTRLGTPQNVLHFENQNENDVLIIAGLIKGLTYFKLTFNVNKAKVNTTFELKQFEFWRGEQREHFITTQNNGTEHTVDHNNTKLSGLFPDSKVSFDQFLPNRHVYSKSIVEDFDDQLKDLERLIEDVNYRQDNLSLEEVNTRLIEETRHLLWEVAKRLESSLSGVVEAANECHTYTKFAQFCVVLIRHDKAIFDDFALNFKLVSLRQRIKNIIGSKSRPVSTTLPHQLRSGVSEIKKYFEDNVHYLGPLRDDPRVIYAIPTNIDFRHVGLKGEFTASMLNLYGQDIVDYPTVSSDERIPHQIAKGTLIDAVVYWLKLMGLADSLDIKELTNIGYELNIHQSNMPNKLALTNVGVGVSQVLPTLVMCLLVDAPCTLLIEQPELHLHPRVQSILGDFLLGLTYINKQIIVETHSEHIINRLLLRIAEDGLYDETSSNLLEKIGILFVEKEGTSSTLRRVRPNEYGTIKDEEWPQGFLDQSTTEIQRKIEAAKEKRHKNKPRK